MKRKAGLVVATFLVVLLGLEVSTFAAEGSFERTLNVTGPVNLSVTTGSGNISITPGTSGVVRVVGHIRGLGSGGVSGEEQVKMLVSNPPIQQSGNSIEIGQLRQEQMQNVSVSYEITTPADTTARATTGSGDATVEGIRGPLQATSGSGGIRVRRVEQEVRLQTGSGNVELDTVGGAAQVTTGSGDIGARSVTGGLFARTGSGSIDAGGTPTAPWKLETGSGNLRLHVPRGGGFEVDARTGSGRINSDLPITLQGSVSRGRMHGQIGGGGVLLSLSTGSGNIEIE